MATKKFLVDIDLGKNSLNNARIQNLSADPSSPVTGQQYFNTVTGRLRVYSGTAWIEMGSAGDGGVTSVNGQTGAVVITKSDVGLSNVDNTSDVNKPVSTAQTAAIEAAKNRANHTGTQSADTIVDGTTNKVFTATEKTKLSGIATGATANDTDANLKNRANHTGTQTASTISDFASAADARITNAAGDTIASLVGGKVPTSQIPSVALSQVFTAANQTAMLALDTQEGDIVIRSDQSKTYVRNSGTAGTMADYTELATPTDAVTSVNGQTGIVVLGKADVGLGNVDNTADADKPISSATQTALNGKANTSHTHTASQVTDFSTAADARITAQKATANGIATLDSGTKVPIAQIPTGTTSTTVSLGNHTHSAGTTSAAGFATLATQAETNARSISNKVVTPAGLASFTRKVTGTIGDGTATTIAVTHDLGQWVVAQLYEVATNSLVEVDIVLTSSTVTTFNFNVAPTTNQYRYIIQG